MEKIESIRKGMIWLNVFKMEDGQILMTVTKTNKDKNGKWNQTPYLITRRGENRQTLPQICPSLSIPSRERGEAKKPDPRGE